MEIISLVYPVTADSNILYSSHGTLRQPFVTKEIFWTIFYYLIRNSVVGASKRLNMKVKNERKVSLLREARLNTQNGSRIYKVQHANFKRVNLKKHEMKLETTQLIRMYSVRDFN